MRRVLVPVVIVLLAIFPVTAVAQVPEPYHRQGETPLVIVPTDINPTKGDVAEYTFRLDLVGEDAVEQVWARTLVAVIERAPGGETVLGAALQVGESRGFSAETAAQLQGAAFQVLLLLNAKNELLGALPEDALESVFTSWLADYVFLWRFFKSMPEIESGVPIPLKNGAMPVVESRDDAGQRYIQVHLQDPRLRATALPTPYAPALEVTLIPKWPLIRSLRLVGSKPLMTEIGPRIPVYTLVLTRVVLAPR